MTSDAAATTVASTRNRLELLFQLSFSLADQVVVSACTFLTMVLISNHCTKEHVGVYALTATIINLMRTVQDRMITAPYLTFAYRPGFDRPTFRGSVFVHQAILASVGTTVILLLALFGLWLGYSPAWMYVFGSTAAALPLTLVRDQIRAMSAASFQIKQQFVFDVAIGASQLFGLMILSWLQHFSIVWVNVMIGLSCVVPNLAWFIAYGRTLDVDQRVVVEDWHNNWEYSRWLVGARVFGMFGYFLVPWLLWYYRGEAATGVFAVCSSLVGISLMFVTGLNNLFQPRTIRELQRNGMRGMLYSIVESIVVIFGILTCISMGFYAFGSYALGYVFGDAYREYGQVAFLLSLSTLVVSLSTLFGNGLAALGNSKEYFWGEFSSCVVSVLAALLLIPLLNLHGAALALALGGAASTLVTGWTLYRGIRKWESPVDTESAIERTLAVEVGPALQEVVREIVP